LPAKVDQQTEMQAVRCQQIQSQLKQTDVFLLLTIYIIEIKPQYRLSTGDIIYYSDLTHTNIAAGTVFIRKYKSLSTVGLDVLSLDFL
jgi:hypothetical protein